MISLTEDTISDDVEVHYQTPEELRVKDHTPEIVHDDNIQQSDNDDDMEFQVDKNVPSDTFEDPIDNPNQTEYQNTDLTPIDAINRVKCDPNTVSIAKYGNKYYIDHKDLKCYMDACGEKKYESALNSIINAHNDPNLCAESVRVVMGKNDMLDLDSDIKLEMESSSVRFEIY